MKTELFTFVLNRPDLLPKQIECFKKFFIGEYNLTAVCDYKDTTYLKEFREICKKYKITLHEHPQGDFGYYPSLYHGSCMTWAYQNFMPEDGYGVFLDHDIFLIDEFNLEEHMKGFDVSGTLQERGDVKYIWPGLTMLDLAKVKDYKFNFLPCTIRGHMLDAGGGTYKLVEELKYKPTFIEYPDTFEGIDLSTVDEGYGFELHLDQKFLHSRNAGRWDDNYNVDKTSKKTEVLNLMFDSFLQTT